MYCAKCGKEIKDDAQFCKYCGAIVKKRNEEQPVLQEEVKPVSLEEVQPEKPKKKSKTGIVIGIVALVVVLLAGAGAYFFYFSKTRIDLEQYYETNLYGVNGSAKMEVSLNEEGMKEEMLKSSSEEEKIDELISSIEITLDPKEGLSNDDEVKVEVTYDETIASELKMKFKNTKETFTVSGLSNTEAIDAFEDVEIEYEGYSPALKIKSITNATYPQLTYEADKTENIENGDTLTITCTNDADELAKEGYSLSEESQKFVVDEEEVLTQLGQLSDTQLNNLVNFARTVLDDHTPLGDYESTGDYRSYTSGNYEGTVIGCKDSSTDVYIIFSRTITYVKTGKYIKSYGVVKYTDLNIEDISYDASVVDHNFYNSNWNTNPDGFETLESAVSAIKDYGYETLDGSEGLSIDE